MSAVGIHRLDPRRAPAVPGMRGTVRRTDIRLGLDDAGPVPASPPAACDPGAEQIAGDAHRVPPEERTTGLREATRGRIEDEPGIRTALRYHSAARDIERIL